MKSIKKTKREIGLGVIMILLGVVIIAFGSCRKDRDEEQGAAQYSSDVLDKWMTLQLRLMKNATGVPNHGFSRHFAYAGVAALESIRPGVNHAAHWNNLTGLPVWSPAQRYYYPANVNAALASISRFFFPNANASDKQAIDSLEEAIRQSFTSGASASVLTASSNFGKAVATAVFAWAETDGYKDANAPYTVPVGPGKWSPTPPAFASPATPYWGNNRSIVAGSLQNTTPPAPPVFSTDPASPFFGMVKQVADVSNTLTDDQKAMAIFWRDVPGVSSPGHWVSIVQQLLRKKTLHLDKAVAAYALSGAALNDALIACFKAKYQYNLVRPITFIRQYMDNETWNSYIGTPAHPEYPSAHSSLSAAAAFVLQQFFGNTGPLVDHTYDYMGLNPRTYPSITAIGAEAGQSRLYAGIHYQVSIDEGLKQGRKVANNILSQHH